MRPDAAASEHDFQTEVSGVGVMEGIGEGDMGGYSGRGEVG